MGIQNRIIDILGIVFGILCILLVWVVLIPIKIVMYIIDLGNMIENKIHKR